jgi:hypothetical protein
MNRQFAFAPGLPGYGSRGIDGSAGLQGLALYFSQFNGVNDVITIKTKILNNKILFITDEFLPGYPIRTYQTGDMFVDINNTIWKIDFATSNKYVSTGITFGSGGGGDNFFELLKNIPAIGYTRYSNNFSTNPALADVVLRTGGSIDYTLSLSSLYISEPDQYAQWKYVNVQSADNGGNIYYPFTLFTAGNDADSIGIVREQASNTWHIGNLDDTKSQRSIDLALDFEEIKLGAFAGVTSSKLYSAVDLSINGEINLTGDVNIKALNPTHYIQTESGNAIGNLVLQSKNSATANVKGGNIELYAGDGPTYDPGDNINALGVGGAITILAGTGAISTNVDFTSDGGDGGNLTIDAGAGGGTTSNSGVGGDGGDLLIEGGTGGTGDTTGGFGGNLILRGGRSGLPTRALTKTGYVLIKTDGDATDSIPVVSGDIGIEAALVPGSSRGNIWMKGNTIDASAVNINLRGTNATLASGNATNVLGPLITIKGGSLDASTTGTTTIAAQSNINLNTNSNVNVKQPGFQDWAIKRTYWGAIKSTATGTLPESNIYSSAHPVASAELATGIIIPGIDVLIKFSCQTYADDNLADEIHFWFQRYHTGTADWVYVDHVTMNRNGGGSRPYYIAPLSYNTQINGDGRFRVLASYFDAAGTAICRIEENSILEVFLNQ